MLGLSFAIYLQILGQMSSGRFDIVPYTPSGSSNRLFFYESSISYRTSSRIAFHASLSNVDSTPSLKQSSQGCSRRYDRINVINFIMDAFELPSSTGSRSSEPSEMSVSPAVNDAGVGIVAGHDEFFLRRELQQ